MTEQKANTPIAFKIALLNLVAGTIGIILSLIFTSVTSGASGISIGLILLGVGEFVNNPQYNAGNTNTTSQDKPSNYLSRRRNVSSLGNLLDIAGVLMLFIGAAKIFF